jgi:transcriptional antiterminator RfaH
LWHYPRNAGEGHNILMAEIGNSSHRWCVVQTKPREEEIAVAHLRRQCFDVFLPLLKEPVVKNHRGQEAKIVPMFPGYLFVAIHPATTSWLPIASTRGVKRMITSGPERPALLPTGWVEELQRRGTLDLFIDALSFSRGDTVEFIAGPFEGHIGKCNWISERRVGLLLDLLGRTVPVDCEPRLLKLVRRDDKH